MNVVFRSDARRTGKGFRMDVMCFSHTETEFQTGQLTEISAGEVSARVGYNIIIMHDTEK